ncbi:DNA mismatch repair protein MutS [Legionella antarctica]|uniref:DNA mismatch repair protein MutS n=1 Tax=Legionella antarctica TaxID=2708020 RepID=A0A6F8T310_9GAMM|nr:Smr/MutS family protein [Legionella antarctica]BCA94557.1 DNA mismatch repair protein MutS [Legionella antarctica]
MGDDFMSDEDKALFRDQMRSVKPLNEKTKRISRCISLSAEKSPKIPNRRPGVSNKQPPKKEYYLSDFISETVLSDTVLSYCNPGVPIKRFRALKNGMIPWEARLDLHGLKTEAARDSLSQFIQAEANKNKRCLLIIHGKGGHQGAPPVIKNLVNRWLPQFDEVLAFHSAQAKDGGHGAVYVFLKRNREDL